MHTTTIPDYSKPAKVAMSVTVHSCGIVSVSSVMDDSGLSDIEASLQAYLAGMIACGFQHRSVLESMLDFANDYLGANQG